jgi:DNA segregation ATPase FtsK/SpoIIIE, S-DNA-T family
MAATNKWSEFRPAIRDLLGTRFELRLCDPYESEMGRALAANVPVGGLADGDVFGVGDGAAAAAPSAPAARPAVAPAGPARIVRGASVEITKPEASAAPPNRLIPRLPDRCAALRPQL